MLFVRWFRQTHKGTRIFAIPNGGFRSKATAAALKAEGASAGVPDLFVPGWNLWIEMKKSRGGKLSSAQRDWINHLQEVGHDVIVAYGAQDAIEKVKVFLEQPQA